MSYLIFECKGKVKGDKGVAYQTTSAIFNYQVLNGKVKFYGSNVRKADVNNPKHWIEIVTIDDNGDTEPFRQHAWDKVMYEVLDGDDVEIYVASGVSG